MTQENKNLLLKDLCTRLPYHVMVKSVGENKVLGLWDLKDINHLPLPYLRPLSSMTEEENKEYISIWTGSIRGDMTAKIDFYIKHHFDFRLTSEGLSMIEAGLALEAPEGMYNIKEK